MYLRGSQQGQTWVEGKLTRLQLYHLNIWLCSITDHAYFIDKEPEAQRNLPGFIMLIHFGEQGLEEVFIKHK